MKQIIITIAMIMSFSYSASAAGNPDNQRFNVYINPIGVLLGVANVGLDFAVSNKLTLGASLSYLDQTDGDVEVEASGAGVRAQLFARDVFTNSWYGTLSYDYATGDGEDTFDGDTASIDLSVLGLKAGYMWRWTNFNIQLAGGIQNVSVDSESTSGNVDIDDLDGTGLALDFSLGLLF